MIDGATVIDFHGHVGRWEYLGMLDNPSPMLRAMNAVGIDRACVFNIFHPDGTRANDCTAAFVAKHPDRFIGFAYVSPLISERMVPELDRAIDTLGFSAIKIYPTYTPYRLNHPAWHPVYQFAHERELTIISHTSSQPNTTEPKYLGDAAALFPNAKFVAAHAGNTEPGRRQAIQACRNHPNFFVETCSTFRTPGVIEELVAEVGADRILYGSDMPLIDCRSQIGKIIAADIGDDAKHMILGENAKRLLRLN